MPRSGDKELNDLTPSQIRLERRILLTRLALFWERLWPAFWPLILIAGLYAISALFGLWDPLAPIARVAGLILFAVFGLAALRPIFRVRWPSRDVALRRIETQSGIPHRPATSFEDRISQGADNPEAETLWQAHKTKLAEELSRMRAVWPRPDFARRDPYALRVPLAMALLTAFLFAGPESWNRMASPFSSAIQTPANPVQIDAWITPPDYTTQPPIFLTGPASARPDEKSGAYTIPAGSEFVLRAQGERLITIGMRPINGAPPDPNSAGSDFAMTAPGENTREYRGFIGDDRHITVLDRETMVGQWRIEVIQDQPPVITMLDPPQASNAGTLRISYRVSDDYGVIAGEGLVERAPAGNDNAGEITESDNYSSPLFDAPRFPLALPHIRTRNGEAQIYQDLTAHPWAGATVLLRLQVHDDTGQIGESEAVEIVLPTRTFTDPLALAIVEQRRKLAITPDQHAEVGRALDALTIAPDRFIEDLQIYLAIRTARWRLAVRHDREGLISVVDQLWQIALRLENGDLADAEQQLRAAQEALQEALARNASPEEIQQRVEDLRQALNEYLQSLAENAQNNNQNGENSEFSPDNALTSQDLARMLDNIENMARNGSRSEAQQLLSQLQDLLENLRMGNLQPQTGQQRQMSESLDQLGDMIDQQRQLMDDSFRREQQDDANGRSDSDRDAELGDMQQRQADLQAALEQLMEQLNSLNSQSLDSFDDAKGNMGDALNSLGEGQTGQAVEDQGEALQNLRDGAGALAEQLAQSLAQSGNRQGNQVTDPLGRPRPTNDPDLGMNVKVPDEIEVQRAREILEELRRRFGERHRPRIELDYFERLLRRF